MSDSSYVTLSRTETQNEGMKEWLQEDLGGFLEDGMLGNIRDYDISRNQQLQFMAQACAADWNDACDVFLGNLVPTDVDKFLTSAARRKFCVPPLPEDEMRAKGCNWACKDVNPTYNGYSPKVCGFEGAFIYTVNGDQKSCPGIAVTDQMDCNETLQCKVPYPQSDTFDFDPIIQRCINFAACGPFFRQLKRDNFAEDNGSYLLKTGIPKPYVPVMAKGPISKPAYYPNASDQGVAPGYCNPFRAPQGLIDAEIKASQEYQNSIKNNGVTKNFGSWKYPRNAGGSIEGYSSVLVDDKLQTGQIACNKLPNGRMSCSLVNSSTSSSKMSCKQLSDGRLSCTTKERYDDSNYPNDSNYPDDSNYPTQNSCCGSDDCGCQSCCSQRRSKGVFGWCLIILLIIGAIALVCYYNKEKIGKLVKNI